MIPAGTQIGFNFAVYDADGVQVEADALPTGVLRVNGVGSTALTIALIENSNPPEYLATGTVPSGAAAGSVLGGRITATVDGLAQSSTEWRDSVGSLTPTVSVVVPQAVAAASQNADTIVARRGDTFSRTFDVGTLNGNESVWFGVKVDKSVADSAAMLIVTRDGLQIANGAVASASGGSISLDTEEGTVTVTVAASVMALITQVDVTANWGLQIKTAAGVVTETRGGPIDIYSDVVRATT